MNFLEHFIMNRSLQIMQSSSLTSVRKLEICSDFMQIFDNGRHWKVIKALSDVRMYIFLRCDSTEIKLRKFFKWRSNTNEQEIKGLTILLKRNRNGHLLNQDSSKSLTKLIQAVYNYVNFFLHLQIRFANNNNCNILFFNPKVCLTDPE